MATHSRTERVAALIQQELGQIFVRGLKDPRIGFVTLTGAKVSPDLREAWIYYTVHGDEADRRRTARGLEAARGFLRRELSARLTLRVTPELHFVIDTAIDHGARIDELLNEVRVADVERAAQAKTEDVPDIEGVEGDALNRGPSSESDLAPKGACSAE